MKPFQSYEFWHLILGSGGVVGLFAIIVSFGMWLHSGKAQFDSSQKDTSISADISSSSSKKINVVSNTSHLRKLESLETGKYMGDLPDGIYGFADLHGMAFFYKDWELVKLRNKKYEDHFEFQKKNGGRYLIGFVGDENFSKMGTVSSSNPLLITLSSDSWTFLDHAVEIPLDSIENYSSRYIDTDSGGMYVLDLRVNAINAASQVHTD